MDSSTGYDNPSFVQDNSAAKYGNGVIPTISNRVGVKTKASKPTETLEEVKVKLFNCQTL